MQARIHITHTHTHARTQAQAPAESKEAAVLDQLRKVIDPDFGDDIVTCGFVKALDIDAGAVSITIELTTPACPVKEAFEQQTKQFVKVRVCVCAWRSVLYS
jgi:metal-sulfur cluster biosynthetic enzyme